MANPEAFETLEAANAEIRRLNARIENLRQDIASLQDELDAAAWDDDDDDYDVAEPEKLIDGYAAFLAGNYAEAAHLFEAGMPPHVAAAARLRVTTMAAIATARRPQAEARHDV